MKHVLLRIRRNPIPAMAVTLFACVITLMLCGLKRSAEEKQEQYLAIYRDTQVQVTVTNLSGTQSDELALPQWPLRLFSGSYGDFFSKYIEDIHYKRVQYLDKEPYKCDLVGMNAMCMAVELWEENGCTIYWNEGYDESIFAGDEPVCLVPAKFQHEDTVNYTLTDNLWGEEKTYDLNLEIAGYYEGGTGKIYCPWAVMSAIVDEMSLTHHADAIHATIVDNYQLEAFRAEAANWFAAPDPSATPVRWPDSPGKLQLVGSNEAYFQLALDIDDRLLMQSEIALRNSLRMNEISTVLVFVLSVAVSFFVGFLMIRARKREIILMRTLGTGDLSIYAGFVLEQMLCVSVGTALGGIASYWQPPEQLLSFIIVYFVGLSAAIVIFLKKNLITTMKEDA